MNNLMYHTSSPSNNVVSGFTEFNTVEFEIDAPNRKLVKNSLRIEATVSVAGMTSAKQIQIDNKVGGHGFFESFVVSMPKSKGVIQNAQEYPRMVAQLASASYVKNDYFCSDLQAELRGCMEINGQINIQPVASHNTTGNQDPTNPSFCIKPLICLNNSSGGNYSFADNGNIRLSMNLAKNTHALHGRECDATTAYTLTDVVCRYMTVPEDGAKDKMIMNSYAMVKNSIQSNSTNISVRVPSNAVGGVSVNFLQQSAESSIYENAYALMPMPEFAEVNYNFSDSTNSYISYTILDLAEARHHGLESLRKSGASELNAQSYKANKGYVLGLDFNGEYVDLTSNKFSMNLKSNSNSLSQTPYLVYLYFHTLIVV